MNKRDSEKLDELEDKWQKREIEEGIRKGLNKWAHTICISATSTAMGMLYWLGGFISERWEPLNAAVKAYLAAIKGQQ